MKHLSTISGLACALLLLCGCAATGPESASVDPTGPGVHYLEIVTPEVDATCVSYARLHGVTFGEPVEALGNARTATLAGGGMIGVRAPMHAAEDPTLRAYLLVDDIEAAAAAAVAGGGEIAHPPFELPGLGTFAIFVQGGVFHALWQL